MKRIIIIVLTLLVGCNNKKPTTEHCSLDNLDYNIYSILLETYVLPEIDSTLNFIISTEEIVTIKNPRRNLLLIDSTKIYAGNINEPFLKSDSLLFNSFKEENSITCELDPNFTDTIKLYRISNSTFRSTLKKDLINGYENLYIKYKDVSGIVEFSRIGYNLNRTKALVEICLYRTPKNSFGLFVWLEIKNGKWNVSAYKTDWMS